MPLILCPIALTVFVTVFAYSPRVSETDGNPWNTACMTRPRVGTVAVSQDLFRQPGFNCGDTITINGKRFVVNDTMNIRHKHAVDIWMPRTKDALRFGVRRGLVCLKS